MEAMTAWCFLLPWARSIYILNNALFGITLIFIGPLQQSQFRKRLSAQYDHSASLTFFFTSNGVIFPKKKFCTRIKMGSWKQPH
ncbi:hypothetical protein R3P38DRAFT_3038567, partial [Favolaschia claudopus]